MTSCAPSDRFANFLFKATSATNFLIMFLNYYCFLLPLLLSYNAGYNFFMLQVLSFQILLVSFNFVFLLFRLSLFFFDESSKV